MASGRKITVEFLGNNSDLDRAMNDSASRAGKFSSALKKAGRVAALGLAAGAVIAGKALFDMTKGAIEDEAAQKQLANQLKKAAGATDDQVASVEDWISKQGELLGVTDDELRPAISALATATGDVAEAQDLATLAMDVAAGKGKSLQSVADALAKAQNGNVWALGKLGIATKDAEGHTKSFAAIQKELAEKYQGAAATAADTTAGKMQRLKVALSETGEAIGYKLIPVVTELAEWFLDKGLPAIQQFGGWMQNNLGPIFQHIGDVIGGIFGDGGAGGKIGSDLGKLRDTIMAVVGVITTLWAKFGDDILTYAKNAFNNLLQVIGGVLDVIRGVVMVFSSLFQGDWKGVWDGIKLILHGALDIILGIVKQALNILSMAWHLAWEGIKALTSAVWEGLKSLVKLGVSALVDADKSIPGRFAEGLSNLKTLVSNIFHAAMTSGLDKVRDIGGTIVDWIRAIPGKIGALADNFRQVGRNLIEAFINGLSAAAGFVSNIAGNVWDALKGMINSAIDHINAALSFSFDTHVPGVGTVSVNPPDIPHLAKGGIVTRPTVALIGEAGPEAVVPLNRRNTPGLGGGVTVIVQTLDPKTAGQAVIAALRDVERRTGRPMLVSPA
jgi:phage-related protein